MKIAHCARCKQEVPFYTNEAPELTDCPRCGLTRLIVKEVEEDCPVCHGKESTIDHHDPCSEYGGSGKDKGMREIKFKVYHKDLKQTFPVLAINFTLQTVRCKGKVPAKFCLDCGISKNDCFSPLFEMKDIEFL